VLSCKVCNLRGCTVCEFTPVLSVCQGCLLGVIANKSQACAPECAALLCGAAGAASVLQPCCAAAGGQTDPHGSTVTSCNIVSVMGALLAPLA
jgi:hypothetical protein